MRADESDNDPVVAEIPVYLAKTLAQQLTVLQYPVRPHSHTYDESTILKTKMRPISGQLEMEMGLRTRGPTYDRSKGEQIALNVDGAFRDKRDSEDNFYKSNVMDKLLLTSTKALSDVHRYAVGVVRNSCLHLTPIANVFALRPSLAYLDQADKRGRKDRKESEEDSDEEDTGKRVTVRFEKPETERSRKAKEKSYGFLLKQIKEEPWIEINYNKFGSDKSEFELRKMYCMYEDERVDQFNLSPADYLNQLVPPTEEVKMLTPGLPVHLMSRSGLQCLDLNNHVKTVMINAGVASFTELVEVLGRGNSVDFTSSVLKVLQQVAVLVQGNWVVKSDLLYPKDSMSETGVSNDMIQRGRDFVLYLFTKNTSLSRSEVSDMIRLPGNDVREILSGVSRYCTSRSVWEFLLPTDAAFLKKYPEVFQRQQMIWQSRSEQLSHAFKDKQIKQEDSKVGASASRKSRSLHSRTNSTDDWSASQSSPLPAKHHKANVEIS